VGISKAARKILQGPQGYVSGVSNRRSMSPVRVGANFRGMSFPWGRQTSGRRISARGQWQNRNAVIPQGRGSLTTAFPWWFNAPFVPHLVILRRTAWPHASSPKLTRWDPRPYGSGCSNYNRFVRTTRPVHRKICSKCAHNFSNHPVHRQTDCTYRIIPYVIGDNYSKLTT